MTTAGTRRAIVVMAKRPAAGRTKTRLSPSLTPQQAANIYECFLLDTLDRLGQRSDCTVIIAIDEPSSREYFAEIAPGTPQIEQVGDALGERLDSVLSACLDQGFDAVFAIGSDSPDLPSHHLDLAFTELDRATVDVVLGPAEDGGYYLIGWKQSWTAMVTKVVMSTPTVLTDTVAIAGQLGARVSLGESWYDVDTPADLDRLHVSLAGETTRTATFLGSLR